MRLSKLTWIGISCVSVAFAIFGGWALWLETRIDRPVYVPVSIRVGHIRTPEFRVNLTGLYEIRIESKKRIPFDALNCLLGMSMPPQKCDVSPVVRANWVVTSKGDLVAKGTSDAEKGGAWANDTIERQIGSFQGNWNRHYVLDVDFTADGTALAATDPHLVVGIPSDFYEGGMWISYFLSLICSAIALLGVVLLTASAIRVIKRRERAQRSLVS